MRTALSKFYSRDFLECIDICSSIMDHGSSDEVKACDESVMELGYLGAENAGANRASYPRQGRYGNENFGFHFQE